VTARPFPNLTTPAGRWPPIVALGSLFVVAALLPERYGLLPPWVKFPMWGLLAVLLGTAVFAASRQRRLRLERSLGAIMLTLMTGLLVVALVRLVYLVFREGARVRGIPLLSTGITLWFTNLVVFALWYWMVDRGGPDRRATGAVDPDLLFPQASINPHPWIPSFFDYLFVAFTVSVAFSPCDAAPISTRAKMFMMMQSGISLVTIVIVVARAVNLME
jgi:uncharacterized membrane protein